VARWWAGLDVGVRLRLERDHPEWIRHLAGVPEEVRHRANVGRLEPARKELELRLWRLGPPVRGEAPETVLEREAINELLKGCTRSPPG
jgi:hypothetical protein